MIQVIDSTEFNKFFSFQFIFNINEKMPKRTQTCVPMAQCAWATVMKSPDTLVGLQGQAFGPWLSFYFFKEADDLPSSPIVLKKNKIKHSTRRLVRQTTCCLQAQILATTVVAEKSGQCFFFGKKPLILKQFQPKNIF